MRDNEPASGSFESPFAMTILPSKAASRSRKTKSAEAPAQYPQTYPAAPGFPPPPPYVTGEAYEPPQIAPFLVAAQAPGAGQPGFPPPGYAHIDFLDDPNGEEPAPRPSKRRGRVLIAVPIVLALAAGGYLYGPKLLGGSSASAKPPTIILPAKIGTHPKATDNKTLAVLRTALPKLRAETPALANVAVAVYGPKTSITVAAGLLPKVVAAKTPADQTAVVNTVNKAAADPATGPDRLKLAVQPNTKGQLWCAFTAGKGSALGLSDCLWVDQHALVMTTVEAKSASIGIAKAQQVVAAVELP